MRWPEGGRRNEGEEGSEGCVELGGIVHRLCHCCLSCLYINIIVDLLSHCCIKKAAYMGLKVLKNNRMFWDTVDTVQVTV